VVSWRTIAGLKSIGPYSQRYGAWARKVKAGMTLLLILDSAFVEHAKAGHPTVRVTYPLAAGASSPRRSEGSRGKWL